MEEKWSSSVEDLVDRGDTDGAISLLESLISKFESLDGSASDLRLASALTDLANLYSSRGLSIKYEEILNRAFLIKNKAQQIHSPRDADDAKNLDSEEAGVSNRDALPSDDDWEAIADRASTEIFSPQLGVSDLSLKDNDSQTPKRRGRGSFMYGRNILYSDQETDITSRYDSEDDTTGHDPEEGTGIRNSKYRTSHILVLGGFPTITQTTALEKDFESYKDRGVVIRWVNDTVALAVFQTPVLAHEALKSSCCPYILRVLEENDDLLSSLSAKGIQVKDDGWKPESFCKAKIRRSTVNKLEIWENSVDLEPPYPRPKTSVRTAQRLIAQGIGLKLSTTFGSSELRIQEEERRNRVLTRKIQRDDAWGTDDDQ